jgi:hypothetical protein
MRQQKKKQQQPQPVMQDNVVLVARRCSRPLAGRRFTRGERIPADLWNGFSKMKRDSLLGAGVVEWVLAPIKR